MNTGERSIYIRLAQLVSLSSVMQAFFTLLTGIITFLSQILPHKLQGLILQANIPKQIATS